MTNRTTLVIPGLRALIIVAAGLFCASLQAADPAADKVAAALKGNFYEIEFFVFERNAVLEFNTREVLVHQKPELYPASMLALRAQNEAFGSSYQIDAATRLCLPYPSIEYTVATPADEPDPMAVQPAEKISEVSSETAQQPLPSVDLAPVPAATPAQELQQAIAEFEQQLYARSNSWMPAESFLLSSEARQIERRANARILFHGRWLQPLPPRAEPLPVMVLGGETVAEGRELMGSAGVTLGRYLHFQAELNYAAPALDAYPLEVGVTESGSTDVVPAAPAAGGFMTLSQSRRMRSGELHYLDHPKLGILVRIDPVTIPQTLIDLALALEKREQ